MSYISNTSFLDANNILWKIIDGNCIGKRSVWTFDNRACWVEDTELNNIKSWWCGENENYKEQFYMENKTNGIYQ